MVHRKRVELVTDLIAEALEGGWDRERVKREIYKRYSEEGISPFRGIALPPDILDKEMATIYVISKYGLGLDEDLGEVIEFERKLESAAKALLEKGKEARDEVLELLGPVDSNVLSRIFRIIFTAVVLGFRPEEDLIKLLHKALEAFPEMDKTIRKYARFYIAFRVAEAIAKGDVKSRVEKEAMKQSLALRINLPKIIPDDNYIYIIAREVFKVPEERLRRILKVKEGEAS
ncbi:MAG: DUF2192 domain-containing protein [Crenarchaeota archaeon]|nr:DUF2192 domain-containing protein [Thermoproteota archaeon]